MLKTLQIRNYQCNEKLDVEFSPQVTSIVGRTAAGKSSVLRALWWILTNHPAGDEFINWDAKKTIVRLEIDDNLTTRAKGKNRNIYKLDDKKYTAFGNDVPADIAKLFNISDVNFQGQFDAPFWFSETAGEVSRQLNRIVNLEVIDTTLANIASEIRKNKTEIEVVKERLDKIKKQREELRYVKQLDTDLIEVESLKESVDKKAVKHARIDELLKSVILQRQTADRASEQAKTGKLVVSKGILYYQIAQKVENMSILIENHRTLQKDIQNRPPSIKPLEILQNKILQAKVEEVALRNMIDNMSDNFNDIIETKDELIKAKKELSKIKVCPLCQRPMTK